MADDQNIDVNINTVVDRESLDQLNGDLTDLQNKSIDIPVDQSGLDDLKNNAGDADKEVGGLKDNLNGIDGGGAKEASNNVSQVGSSAANATGAVTDLTDVLGLIASAIAVGGVVLGIDSIASSADAVNEKMNAMRINFGLDPSGLTAATDDINNLNNSTGVAKGTIRDFDNKLGMAGVSSVKLADGIVQTAAQVSYLQTGSNDATDSITSMFARSIFSGKMADRAFATNGISLDQMAQRAGYTKDQMTDLFASMTPDQRANFLQQYAVDSGKAEEANKGLEESYDTLKDKFDQKVGALGTAFGQMVLPILIPAISVAIGALTSLTGVINSLPDWAKTAIGVGILVASLVLISGVIWSTVIPAITAVVAEAIIGFANMILPILGVCATMTTLDGALATLTAFEMMAITPALLLIAAILAIGAAIYFVGQYFGWWHDLPSMFSAIQAGVMRLWDAFANNDHVQAVIAWLKAAWQGVVDFLQPLFAAITGLWNNIFPPKEGGFDIIASVIALFGWLGNTIASVVGWIQANWPLVSIAIMPIIAPLQLIISILQLIVIGFTRVVNGVQTGANLIRAAITTLSSAWNSFASTVMSAYNTYIAPVIDGIQNGINKAREFLNLQSQTNQGGGDAFGGTSGGTSGGEELPKINYPDKNYYEINFNGLVTEQSMIDYLLALIEKGHEQDDMRT